MDKAIHASPSPPAPAAPDLGPDLTGRTLGDYRILRRLGQGGMGAVYLAEQVSLKRKVALKFLRPDLAANPTALSRFKLEAEAVARATHANIVQVYAIGEAGGMHYMALEYVEGRNLKEYIARKGPPDVLLALSVMHQAAAALQRASELGIIHRDIKPENLLLTRTGEVKVADFGLSRCLTGDQPLNLTQSGVTMGTPLYMSPEQVEGKPLDARTDIYSLGVTCYHMLAGEPPFRGTNAFEVALHHVRTEPPPLATFRPDLPADLCAAVHRMMAKDPGQRYQSCRELLQELARIRDSVSGATGGVQLSVAPVTQKVAHATPTTGSIPTTPRVRHWLWLAVPASVLLAAAAGAGVAWYRHQSLAAQPPAGMATSTHVEDPAVAAMFSVRAREKFLAAGVEQYINPGNDPTRIRLGQGHCLELGLFYLEEWRLKEADDLFTRLDTPQQVKPYQTLGQLGKAMVLAFRNQPDESNSMFLHLTQGEKPSPAEQLVRQNPRLRQMVAKALQHNYVNDPKKFPQALQHLRRPPAPPPELRTDTGPEKPRGKP